MEPNQNSQVGNTKRPAKQTRETQCVNWCFTYNNYNDVELEPIKLWCQQNCKKATIGKEIGANGTKHLQGAITLKTKMRFSQLKAMLDKVHWEKMRSPKDAFEYCRKGGDILLDVGHKVEDKPRTVSDPLAGKQLYGFQQEVIDLVKTKPDERTIHWYWENDGNIGKTALTKSICINNPNTVLAVSGKCADIKYAIKEFLSCKKNDLKIVIFDFVRSNEQFISYEALECIKNGLIFSTKYESGMIMYDCPHVICFANFPPDLAKLSADRWKITKIEKT